MHIAGIVVLQYVYICTNFVMGAGIVVFQYAYILDAMFSVMNQRYDEEEEVIVSRKGRKTTSSTGEPKKPKNMSLAVQDLQDTLATKGEKLKENMQRLGHHVTMLFVCSSCFHVSNVLIPH